MGTDGSPSRPRTRGGTRPYQKSELWGTGFPPIRPFFRAHNKAGPNRVLIDIFALFFQGFVMADTVVEKTAVPTNADFFRQASFKIPDQMGKLFALPDLNDHVNMVRHP